MVRSYDSKREPRDAPGNARNQTARPGSGKYLSREGAVAWIHPPWWFGTATPRL